MFNITPHFKSFLRRSPFKISPRPELVRKRKTFIFGKDVTKISSMCHTTNPLHRSSATWQIAEGEMKGKLCCLQDATWDANPSSSRRKKVTFSPRRQQNSTWGQAYQGDNKYTYQRLDLEYGGISAACSTNLFFPKHCRPRRTLHLSVPVHIQTSLIFTTVQKRERSLLIISARWEENKACSAPSTLIKFTQPPLKKR